MKKLEKDSEVSMTGKLIAKTILKNVVGLFGIDTSISENDLQNIYSSIDLNGKLLIFEDLERSSIDLITVLSYINHLVERDGVKVLLVANENEILNKISNESNIDIETLLSSDSDNQDKEDKNNISEDIQKYLRIKEKTISDTICFESDYYKGVKNILDTFENIKLQEIINEDSIKKLVEMVKSCCNKNFRTFIFATQKTVDIFDEIKESCHRDFLECIYFGIIYFSAKIKAEEFPMWEGTEFLSTRLGNNHYPLFRFCYDYIRWQKIDITKVKDTMDAYDKMKLYDKNIEWNDADLQKLYSYDIRKESEVRDVLNTIEKRLKNSDIGFYSYGKLAAYFVALSYIIGFDYTQCKEYMIKNIEGKGDSIDSNLLFLPIYDFVDDKKEELENFIRQLSESMNIKSIQKDFSYKPDDIRKFYIQVIEEKDIISSSQKFISQYDAIHLVEMFFHASAEQIKDFRNILFTIYRYVGKGDFIEADINTMKKIQELTQKKLDSNTVNIDKIQIYQLNLLCNNLKEFISQMS